MLWLFQHAHTSILAQQIQVQYLHSNIHMDHKVFARSRPEQKVEVSSCQPQRLAALLGYQDVAVARNRTPDPKHWTLQRLVLGGESANMKNYL